MSITDQLVEATIHIRLGEDRPVVTIHETSLVVHIRDLDVAKRIENRVHIVKMGEKHYGGRRNFNIAIISFIGGRIFHWAVNIHTVHTFMIPMQ